MYLHVLGVNVLQLPLGAFKVNVKYELNKIRRRGGLQIYPRVLGVCPKLNLHGYPQTICGINGVYGAIVHNAPAGVTEIGALKSLFKSSRFLWVF